ncbi:putative MFS transporter [Aspergillus lucknowensis]|uniref:Major facilitator superfamily domain-containing protein n=1 Tax=Aspergillus lucknowensis TaxID=176173 RepID=A0ABR4LTA2_9EURO
MASESSPRERGRPSLDEIQPADDIAVTSSSSSAVSVSPPLSAAANPASEAPPALTVTGGTESSQNHTAFSTAQKRLIVCMVTLASFFSPLSGQIYYPVIPTLAENYHLTPALINLTITTYMLLQGLAPAFMGTFADAGGRRPAYILAFTIYTAANIGLAVQNSYPALMVLRCIQSAGSSGTVSFGYGVIADIATPAERGTYVGPMAAGIMIAPALGPVIGGLLAKFLGWRSVFWFLVIISGGFLAVYIILVPETARKIVGDGSALPAEWWRRSVVQWWQQRSLIQDGTNDGTTATIRTASSTAGTTTATARASTLRFPNPLKSFAILLERDALIIISYIGLVMLSNVALLTSTPSLFTEIYGFNNLEIGLCFLPLGVGAALGAITNGKILDWNYRRHALAHNFPVDRKRATDLRHFPIEHARLQSFFPIILLSIASYLPYGWVLQQRAHLSAPLILQFLNGFATIASSNTLNTLLVDLFPDRPATAAAACNLVRCWLGALGAAVVDYMLRSMGWGWCFVFLGLVMLVGTGMMWVEYVFGSGWREKRAMKKEKKERVSKHSNSELGGSVHVGFEV